MVEKERPEPVKQPKKGKLRRAPRNPLNALRLAVVNLGWGLEDRVCIQAPNWRYQIFVWLKSNGMYQLEYFDPSSTQRFEYATIDELIGHISRLR